MTKEERRKEYLKNYNKEWRVRNAEHIKNYNKKYKQENEKAVKAQAKKFRLENKDKVKKLYSDWYYSNVEYNQKKRKKWNENNREKINEYRRNRYKTNINTKISFNIRGRLKEVLKHKGYKKSKPTFYYIGCTPQELKQHLESQFTEGMTWENYGLHGWHIDHIVPLSKFDLSKEENIKLASHYSNLQPLWAIDNMKKGNKIDQTDETLLALIELVK